jgi:hypothetical protein
LGNAITVRRAMIVTAIINSTKINFRPLFSMVQLSLIIK